MICLTPRSAFEDLGDHARIEHSNGAPASCQAVRWTRRFARDARYPCMWQFNSLDYAYTARPRFPRQGSRFDGFFASQRAFSSRSNSGGVISAMEPLSTGGTPLVSCQRQLIMKPYEGLQGVPGFEPDSHGQDQGSISRRRLHRGTTTRT